MGLETKVFWLSTRLYKKLPNSGEEPQAQLWEKECNPTSGLVIRHFGVQYTAGLGGPPPYTENCKYIVRGPSPVQAPT